MAEKDRALHKRQQIIQSGRMMFVWVAIASVVIGVTLVASWFLVQQIMFRQKVVNEKIKTASILQDNNKAVKGLQDNVRVLETNQALNSAKASPNEKALQVPLDALPAERNTLALGASIQEKLVGGQPNVTLESLDVMPSDTASSTSAPTSSSAAESLGYTLAVSSPDSTSLRDLLTRFESSVRIMDVDAIKLERGENKMSMILNAHAFYLPEKTVELGSKTVRPNK